MSLWRLIFHEIGYRKLNFVLGVLSVVVAVGCLVGELSLLRQHDQRTGQIIAEKEAQTQAKMQQVEEETRRQMSAFEKEAAQQHQQLEDTIAERRRAMETQIAQETTRVQEETAQRMKLLEDDFRKITKNLGFNLLILPKDQNLSDLYADDFASKYMPEEYVDRLSRSGIASINHLLPTLVQKLKWPEQERTVIVTGMRGEVPIVNQDPKKPLLEPVPAGRIVVGYELHRNLNLKVGDRVKLLGQEFEVSKLHPERGNKDDITVWINLEQAQAMLDRKGQINALLALECNCAADRLDKIRQEIAAILPETQVIEFATQALARAEARNRAKKEADETIARTNAWAAQQRHQFATWAADERLQVANRIAAARHSTAQFTAQQREQTAAWAADVIQREKASRTRLRHEREDFAALLIPMVMVGCVVWLGVLTFTNVRDRSVEIGILRALGLTTRQVLTLFLGKAALMGFVGALLGLAGGAAIGAVWGETQAADPVSQVLFDNNLLIVVLAAAPVLCILAGWMPALMAVRQDPAVVLREA